MSHESVLPELNEKIPKNKRKRSRNFTIKEKEILTKLINPNNYIVRNKSADRDSKDLRRRTWQRIFENFKSLTNYKTERTLEQIKIYWKNQSSKKKIRENCLSPMHRFRDMDYCDQKYYNYPPSFKNYPNCSKIDYCRQGQQRVSNSGYQECSSAAVRNEHLFDSYISDPKRIDKYIDSLINNTFTLIESLEPEYKSVIEMLLDVRRTIDFYKYLLRVPI